MLNKYIVLYICDKIVNTYQGTLEKYRERYVGKDTVSLQEAST